MRLDITPAGSSSSGGKDTTQSISQTAHGFAVGDWVYVNGAGTYAKAKADAEATAEAIGIVTVVTDVNTFTLTMSGYVNTAAAVPAGTAGDVFFVSPTTAGAITATKPVTVGHIVKPVAVLETTASKMIVKILRGNTLTATPTFPTIKQTEIDFGTTPVADGTFTVTDGDVTTSMQVIGQIAYEAPTGKDLDEIEMDDLQVRCAPGSGQFTCYIKTADGSYLADKFKLNYTFG